MGSILSIGSNVAMSITTLPLVIIQTVLAKYYMKWAMEATNARNKELNPDAKPIYTDSYISSISNWFMIIHLVISIILNIITSGIYGLWGLIFLIIVYYVSKRKYGYKDLKDEASHYSSFRLLYIIYMIIMIILSLIVGYLIYKAKAVAIDVGIKYTSGGVI